MSGRGPSEAPCEHRDRERCDVHDAMYCPRCDMWLEPKCSDPDCDFCHRRPDRPSEVARRVESGSPTTPTPNDVTHDLDAVLAWFTELEHA